MSASAAEPERGQCRDGAPGQIEDIEKLPQDSPSAERKEPTSIFRGLGILDRYLALWIFLAMTIGIILGNFVNNIGRSLQKGALVGVSLPIGELSMLLNLDCWAETIFCSLYLMTRSRLILTGTFTKPSDCSS